MAKYSAGAAVANYLRKYHLAPSYRPEHRIRLTAGDGTALAAVRMNGPADAPCTVVVVHGFVNWARTPAIHAFAHALAEHVDVIVPDLRGHGRSGGLCTFGREEPDDVAVAIAAADPAKPVVTVGVSLGGAIALLHAGRHPGSIAGTVAVSAPAFWGGVGTEGASRIERWISTAPGRLVLRGLLRTRLSSDCAGIPDAAATVARISPAFTIVVADPADWYFGPEHAERLHQWAGDPKELWWYPGGGHGTDLLTTGFAERLLGTVRARLAVAPPDASVSRRPRLPPSPSR